MHLNNYLQRRFGATMRGHVRWDIASAGPPNEITWHCAVYINDELYGVGVDHFRGASRDAAARHALETLEREGLTISRSGAAKTFPYRSSHTKERPPGSTLTHPDQSICATNAIPTLFEARPRVMLNNELQLLYGTSAPSHVMWKFVSTGTTHAPSWHATVYIDDMAYGTGEASTKNGARDAAALQAWQGLRREGMRW
ncbi:hypothetical protein M405DRAFT_460381 [Rhizopogon salebrosus TDB-379]|nr:hypothetical protein M405DRAFT_460381 [Rhizopogon salebrosus TDB-379]